MPQKIHPVTDHPASGSAEHKNAGGPGSFVLVIDAIGVRLGRGDRLPRLLQQLHGL